MSDRLANPRAALTLAATLTLGMASWLAFVTTAILPARDPQHVPLWRGVALGFLAYTALSAWSLVRSRARGGAVHLAMLAASAAACGLGGYAIVTMLFAGADHFEGYLLVMGVLLLAHGATGIVWERASTHGGAGSPPQMRSAAAANRDGARRIPRD